MGSDYVLSFGFKFVSSSLSHLANKRGHQDQLMIARATSGRTPTKEEGRKRESAFEHNNREIVKNFVWARDGRKSHGGRECAGCFTRWWVTTLREATRISAIFFPSAITFFTLLDNAVSAQRYLRFCKCTVALVSRSNLAYVYSKYQISTAVYQESW